MRSFALSCFLTMTSICQVCADCSHSCNSIFQEMQVEFGYNTGRYISIDEDYSEVGIFAPLFSTNSYSTFLDAHGYRFNDGKWAASIGGGVRKNLSESSVLGFNAYYDYRRGESKHNFNQIGLGAEWLNSCWDMRVNAYLPFFRKTQASFFYDFDNLGNGFFSTRREIEYAYSGFDAEIGLPLLSYCDFSLYGAAGPYYYTLSHQENFWGGHGRLELNWKSILSLQIQISYDNVYLTNVQGVIQISFPLDLCWKGSGCHCLTNPQVQRNGVILTDRCCNWTWNWNDEN